MTEKLRLVRISWQNNFINTLRLTTLVTLHRTCTHTDTDTVTHGVLISTKPTAKHITSFKSQLTTTKTICQSCRGNLTHFQIKTEKKGIVFYMQTDFGLDTFSICHRAHSIRKKIESKWHNSEHLTFKWHVLLGMIDVRNWIVDSYANRMSNELSWFRSNWWQLLTQNYILNKWLATVPNRNALISSKIWRSALNGKIANMHVLFSSANFSMQKMMSFKQHL